METNNTLVSFRGVQKSYDGAALVVKDLNLDVREGEFLTLLGPSGSGKTTCLMMLAGFETPTAGEIRLAGKSINKLPPHQRGIGVVFQHYALFPHMTVAQNLAFPLSVRGIKKADIAAQVSQALAMVQLDGLAQRTPNQLSGGQQQRVALARALVFDPPLLLMDEPLGALDKKLREWLQLEIKRIHRELGTTFVYVTHDQEEALALSDRIAVFNHGSIEQIGTGRELYDAPQTLFVGRFIGESTVLRGAWQADGDQTVLTVGTQRVVAPGQLANGAPPVMLLRPEAIQILPAGSPAPDGHNRLSGQVAECIYLGSAAKYEVTLADDSRAIVRSPLAANPHAIGTAVELVFAPHDVRLLPDDDRAEMTLT